MAAAGESEYSGGGGGARKILVAIDESEESFSALSWAIENILGAHASTVGSKTVELDSPEDSRALAAAADRIVLLHVQLLPHMVAGLAGPGGYPLEDFYFEPEVLESVKKNQEETSRRILSRAKHMCDEKHLKSETMLVSGDARDAISEVISKIEPNFLVIGSHGYGAFKRAFLGSVSDYLVHNAKCPVVIVRKHH